MLIFLLEQCSLKHRLGAQTQTPAEEIALMIFDSVLNAGKPKISDATVPNLKKISPQFTV
jgi:hypothetical protein